VILRAAAVTLLTSKLLTANLNNPALRSRRIIQKGFKYAGNRFSLQFTFLKSGNHEIKDYTLRNMTKAGAELILTTGY